MALPLLDLEAMGRASRADANRQLARYLRETMAPLVRRLPGDARHMDGFVAQAGEAAASLGYGEGRAYAFYVVTSFLLGLGWQSDPSCQGIEPILANPGLDMESRVSLAMQAAIREREQLESALPAMLGLVLETSPASPDRITLRDVWQVYTAVAKQRGLSADLALACFETYEGDYRGRLGLPPVERKPLSAWERLGYQHMGIPLPSVADDVRDMDQRQVAGLGGHVLLAVIYGRHYLSHPLLRALHEALTEPGSLLERWQRWRAFLHDHQTILREA